MKVFINSRCVPLVRARISAFDRGFLYGDGVFETLRAYDGVIFRADQHLERLADSARSIHLRLPFNRKRILSILYRTLEANRIRNGLLRLTLSRGTGPWGPDPSSGGRPTVVVMARPSLKPSPGRYARGMRVWIVSAEAPGPGSVLSGIKTTNFLNNILGRLEARRAGAEEGLMLNPQGHLTEGTVSNLFLVRNGRLITPSLDCGLLNGVTRRVVLELAESLGIPAKEGRLTPKELLRADECFLTNTSIEIMPATRVGKFRVGSGRPGEITLKLTQAFRLLVKRESENRLR